LNTLATRPNHERNSIVSWKRLGTAVFGKIFDFHWSLI
jgi:hypothetical protein